MSINYSIILNSVKNYLSKFEKIEKKDKFAFKQSFINECNELVGVNLNITIREDLFSISTRDLGLMLSFNVNTKDSNKDINEVDSLEDLDCKIQTSTFDGFIEELQQSINQFVEIVNKVLDKLASV